MLPLSAHLAPVHWQDTHAAVCWCAPMARDTRIRPTNEASNKATGGVVEHPLLQRRHQWQKTANWEHLGEIVKVCKVLNFNLETILNGSVSNVLVWNLDIFFFDIIRTCSWVLQRVASSTFPVFVKLKCETHVLIPFRSFPGCESSVKVSTSLLPPSGLAHYCRYIGRGGVFQGEKRKGKKKVVYYLCIWVCALSPSSPIRLFILLRLCVRVGVSARKKNHGLFVFPVRRLFWLLDFDLSTSWSGGSSICAWQTVLALRTRTGEKAASSVSIAALWLEYLTSFRPF